MSDTILADVCDAVESTLADATGLTYTQSFDELSEGVNDTPLLQVYPEEFEIDISSANADRTTFQGGVRQTEILLHCDIYAARRSNLGQNIKKAVELTDACIVVFKQQNTKPYFGLSDIKSFHVGRGIRVIFTYGDREQQFTGWRIPLTLLVF